MIPLTKRRLAQLLRDAKLAYAEHQNDPDGQVADWADWYAEYMMQKIGEEF